MENETAPPEDLIHTRSNARLELARGLLNVSKSSDPVWPAVAAAGFFAICALGFAAAVITLPPEATAASSALDE